MRKLESEMTLVAGAFQDKVIDLDNKKDIFVLGYSIRFVVTPTDLVADEKLSFHISSRDKAAIDGPNLTTPISVEKGLISAVGMVDLSFQKFFKKAIRYAGIDKLYFGALSGAAGPVYLVLYVSEKNISY